MLIFLGHYPRNILGPSSISKEAGVAKLKPQD